MKREEEISEKNENNKGFSEEEFIEYLEKLRLEEQKFREEVLAKQSNDKNSQYAKIEN